MESRLVSRSYEEQGRRAGHRRFSYHYRKSALWASVAQHYTKIHSFMSIKYSFMRYLYWHLYPKKHNNRTISAHKESSAGLPHVDVQWHGNTCKEDFLLCMASLCIRPWCFWTSLPLSAFLPSTSKTVWSSEQPLTAVCQEPVLLILLSASFITHGSPSGLHPMEVNKTQVQSPITECSGLLDVSHPSQISWNTCSWLLWYFLSCSSCFQVNRTKEKDERVAGGMFAILPSIVGMVLWCGWNLLDYLSWEDAWECVWPASLELWDWAKCLLRNPFHIWLFPLLLCFNQCSDDPARGLSYFSNFPGFPWQQALKPSLDAGFCYYFPWSSRSVLGWKRPQSGHVEENVDHTHLFSHRSLMFGNDLQYSFIRKWSEFWNYCLYKLDGFLEKRWHPSSHIWKPILSVHINPYKYAWEWSSFW